MNPAIGSPANAGGAAQATGMNCFTRSPVRLERELRPVSIGPGSQSSPRLPCQLRLVYFPLSQLVCCYPQLSAKTGACQGESRETPPKVANQIAPLGSKNISFTV